MSRKTVNIFRSLIRRWYAFKNFVLGVYGNPILFKEALNSTVAIRARRLESSLRSKAYVPNKTFTKKPTTLAITLKNLASEFAVLHINHSDIKCEIGVADVDMISCILWLLEHTHGTVMTVAGQHIQIDDKNFIDNVLSAYTLSMYFMTAPKIERIILSIEPYYKKAPGKWVSNNPKNSALRAVYSDIFETPGLYHASDLLGAPTLAESLPEEPIDVVYTWVDHSDPEWAALYERYKVEGDDTRTDSAAMTRFHSNDELRFSLRSVAVNLPWIRNIYVFSNCAPPPWLSQNPGRLKWIHHKDVIPDKYLPTFSSHVIESYLHKIEGLSENFIYMNDDVFIGRHLDKHFFFTPAGQSFSFLEEYGMVSGQQRIGDPDYLNASRNSAVLLQDALGFSATQLHKHTAFSLKKSVLVEIEARWLDRFSDFRAHKFRNIGDLNITSFLFHHYALATGQAQFSKVQDAFIQPADIWWYQKLEMLDVNQYDMICINEGGSEMPSHAWHRSVAKKLAILYPIKAEWE